MDTQIVSQENIVPSKGYLLLEIPEKTTQLVSGVLLGNSDNESTPVMGKVISVAANSSYEVGQTIMFRRYSVDELKVKDAEGEKKFYLLEEDSVLATIK